ncbi:hypothetical protein AB0I22_08220 [Streptomyces sp. NPDC050610]|uniref:hypothetical protein n=1 Tax=Streptomyces sp. NPDC050610 TaxID=3157097 RepID=UPI00341EB1B1
MSHAPLGYGEQYRLVTVELVRAAGRAALDTVARARAGWSGTAPALGLHLAAPSGTYVVLARAGYGAHGSAFLRSVPSVILAVDIDARPARRWLECADAPYGTRPRRATPPSQQRGPRLRERRGGAGGIRARLPGR